MKSARVAGNWGRVGAGLRAGAAGAGLLLCLSGGGCGSPEPSWKVGGAAAEGREDWYSRLTVREEPPRDFAVTVVVSGAAGSDASGVVPKWRRQGMYVLDADWSLRTSVAGDSTRVRTLDAEQARRVWVDVRDSGLMNPEHPGRLRGGNGRSEGVGTVQPRQGGIGVSWRADGHAGTVRIGETDADFSGVRRLVDRLSDLAFIP